MIEEKTSQNENIFNAIDINDEKIINNYINQIKSEYTKFMDHCEMHYENIVQLMNLLNINPLMKLY